MPGALVHIVFDNTLIVNTVALRPTLRPRLYNINISRRLFSWCCFLVTDFAFRAIAIDDVFSATAAGLALSILSYLIIDPCAKVGNSRIASRTRHTAK